MTMTNTAADLSTMTTDRLYDELTDALYGTSLGRAVAIADEMCRPERKGTCFDLLSPNAAFPLMRAYTAEHGEWDARIRRLATENGIEGDTL